MKNTTTTAPEADEKTIERLRDALVFDHRDRELLGPETTLRLAFAVCNKLGLIPRSTEHAEIFLNAMRAAGQLTPSEVTAAKIELMTGRVEDVPSDYTFSPDDEPVVLKNPRINDGAFKEFLSKLELGKMAPARCIYRPIRTPNDEAEDQEVSTTAGRVAHFEKYLLEAATELRKIDRPWLANRCYRAAREIEDLILENIRIKGFEEAFLSVVSSLNHLADSLHGRGGADEG